MNARVMQVARREFVSTVMTKAFLFGVLVLPAMMALVVMVMPRLIVQKATRVTGTIAIIDPTNAVVERARERLTVKALAESRRRMLAAVSEVMPMAAASPRGGRGGGADVNPLDQVMGEVPELRIDSLAATADVAAEKRLLLSGRGADRRLALVVVHPDAVTPDSATRFGSYDLYVRARLDDGVTDALREAMVGSLVDARLAARALQAAEIRAMVRVAPVTARTVDVEGEKSSSEIGRMMLPMAFMMLLFISVMTGGQQLLTSTIEEKGSRVMEVLLAAVSPLELMAGKILGQMGASLLLLVLYGGLGFVALITFSALGLIEPVLVVYLVIFFFIAFVTMASMMAGMGSAVTELRDAQALLTPVMLVMMLPMMFWMPITRDPDSMLSTVSSFMPALGPFAMILRLTSNTPPPAWQVIASIVVGVAWAVAAVWAAGRVFRIGVLMYGKPPDLKTLVRWMRTS